MSGGGEPPLSSNLAPVPLPPPPQVPQRNVSRRAQDAGVTPKRLKIDSKVTKRDSTVARRWLDSNCKGLKLTKSDSRVTEIGRADGVGRRGARAEPLDGAGAGDGLRDTGVDDARRGPPRPPRSRGGGAGALGDHLERRGGARRLLPNKYKQNKYE
eukprot:1189395-Prorocentrum_minimum.AAC.2